MEKILALLIVMLTTSMATAGDRIDALIPDNAMPSQAQQRTDTATTYRRDHSGDAINAYPGHADNTTGPANERIPNYDHSDHGKYPGDIRTRTSTQGNPNRH